MSSIYFDENRIILWSALNVIPLETHLKESIIIFEHI